MSLYDVHLVCRTALRDQEFCAALNSEPETALESFDLTPAERQALLEGDVGALYAAGAHEYVLMWLGRAQVLGLNIPEYMKRITAVAPHYIY
jgi:hypothetical protein